MATGDVTTKLVQNATATTLDTEITALRVNPSDKYFSYPVNNSDVMLVHIEEGSGGSDTFANITIDTNDNTTALTIDSEATSASNINLSSVNTSGDIVFLQNTGNHASGVVLNVIEDHSSSAAIVQNIQNDGTGNGLQLDQNGNGTALNIDSEATSADSINIDAVNTSGIVVDINLSPGVASTAEVFNIANDSNCTGTLATFTNAGTGQGIYIPQQGVLAADKHGLFVYSNTAIVNSGSSLCRINVDNASTTTACIESINDGTGNGIYIDQNGLAQAIALDVGAQDIGFINFVASADGDATSAISTLTTSGATTHHIQISLNGTPAWVACSTTDPSA